MVDIGKRERESQSQSCENVERGIFGRQGKTVLALNLNVQNKG